jgi:hypothetical protein
MALVAPALPFDTLTVGKKVVYYDPTFTIAGQKFGTIKTVTWGTAAGDAPVTVVVTPDITGADVTGPGNMFRVVDHFTASNGGMAPRANV